MSASSFPRQSLRQDAAIRAARDGDMSTLKALVDQAALFENPYALRRACESGYWGAPIKEKEPSHPETTYSTKDSILLHNLFYSATTRGHANIVEFLLERFPAKNLHVAEWELMVVALSSGKVKMLKPYIDIDPELINMIESRFGNCYQLVLTVNDEPEDIAQMMAYLKENGANPNAGGMGEEVRQRLNDVLAPDAAETLANKLQIGQVVMQT